MVPGVRQPSDAAVRAWTRINRAQRFVFDRIEADLKQAGLPPLEVYDALLELGRAAGGRLRQVDLERALLFRQYSVSRLVDRLERDGMARRERCTEDGRVSWVAITPSGRALRQAMWHVYAGAVARHVDCKLAPEEAAHIATALEKLYRD
jgi:DNA-binding MarR family transcriptional regulator